MLAAGNAKNVELAVRVLWLGLLVAIGTVVRTVVAEPLNQFPDDPGRFCCQGFFPFIHG